MQCWVWLGCSGFSWIVDLYDGSWWVFAVVRWVGFAIWYQWSLISVVLIDFGGFLISVAGFVGWLGGFRCWVWVDWGGLEIWVDQGCFGSLLWFCDSLIWMILWFCGFGCGGFFFFPSLLLFVVAAMVGGCGGCEMGGWIWWPATLGCERETQRRESQRKREEK